jgi:hypothetical protein
MEAVADIVMNVYITRWLAIKSPATLPRFGVLHRRPGPHFFAGATSTVSPM